jgi:hypothetical protein
VVCAAHQDPLEVAWLELLLLPLLTELLVLELVPELLLELLAVLEVVGVLDPEFVLVFVLVLSCDEDPELSCVANATPVRAATPSDPVSAPATMPVRMRRVRRSMAVRSMESSWGLMPPLSARRLCGSCVSAPRHLTA